MNGLLSAKTGWIIYCPFFQTHLRTQLTQQTTLSGEPCADSCVRGSHGNVWVALVSGLGISVYFKREALVGDII